MPVNQYKEHILLRGKHLRIIFYFSFKIDTKFFNQIRKKKLNKKLGCVTKLISFFFKFIADAAERKIQLKA